MVPTKTTKKTMPMGNCYVYLLFDKHTMEIFYVGKGKGDRFLNHLDQAQKSGDLTVESKKVQKINDIGKDRLGCTILRRNLTDAEAFHIEAAAIDLLRSTSYKNIIIGILNIQSGHDCINHGMIDINQFKKMRKTYVKLQRSETLICLNVKNEEVLKTPYIPQLIHKKKWRVNLEEAMQASYVVVECNNIVIAVFNSKCWVDSGDGKHCIFNGNQTSTTNSVLDRLMSHKLPKRTQGTPQARYINHTDIMNANKHNDIRTIESRKRDA